MSLEKIMCEILLVDILGIKFVFYWNIIYQLSLLRLGIIHCARVKKKQILCLRNACGACAAKGGSMHGADVERLTSSSTFLCNVSMLCAE